MKPENSLTLSQRDADKPHIIEEEFGNYRIKAGRLHGNFVARAFPNRASRGQGMREGGKSDAGKRGQTYPYPAKQSSSMH